MKKLIALAHNDRLNSAQQRRSLEDAGFTIEFCDNGRDVLRMFERTETDRPRLLVTGMKLPSGDPSLENWNVRSGGAFLYERLRTDHPDLPIVICSSNRNTVLAYKRIEDENLEAVCTLSEDALDRIVSVVTRMFPAD